ncbi:MAG: S-layer family protein, partial [Opitutales bacterium]
GKLKFSSAADLSASVVNEGTLTISDAGLGALVAPHVRNSGALVANLGTAVLASGKAFTVDFAGDGLITFALGEGIASTLVGADGQPLKAQVEQAGEVTAGRIVLSAAAAREVVNQSVNVSGLVRAGSAGRNSDGSISLRGSNSVAVESTAVLAAPAGSIVLDADSVKVAGNLFARSLQLTGDHIDVLTGATLSSDGGSILVGGDWQGSNGVRQALTATLEAGAMVDAGQGGKVVLWSDITNPDSITTVTGTVRALGGRIETSGHLLELPGIVQAGIGGLWLIDPNNVTISAGATTGGTLPTFTAGVAASVVNATNIQTAVNSGTTVSILADGTITQSVALAFAPATGVIGGLTLDTRSGTGASKITLAGITNAGAGTVNVSAYSAGVIATTAGITSSSGPINLILQSFNASNTSTNGVAANVLVGAAVTTRGGYVILDGTGGTITGTNIARGSIINGTVYASSSFTINTTTAGLTTSTAGGDFTAAASTSIANSAAFQSNVVTYNIGGKFSVNVATSAAAGWGFVTTGYLTTSPITAYGNLSVTATSTAAALSAANLHVSSALTSTTGSVTLANTSSVALSTNGVSALAITAAVSGATGVTITNSSAHTATASVQNGVNGSGAITSSNGAISITSTTNSTAIPVNYTGALSAKTGITINATGASGATIASLAGMTLTGAGSNLSVTANNAAAGGSSGIVTAGTISLASGSGLSLVSNNLINQTGAISVAANVSGTASNLVFDATTGSSASAITTGNITFVTGSTSDVNLTIKSKGSALNPGTVGTSLLNLPGVLTIDNTNGGTVAAANAVAGVGLTLNGPMYAGKGVVLSGVSNGNNAIQTSAAVATTNGNLIVNALGTTAIAYYGSAAAGTLTATNGSVSLSSVSTTGSAINIVTGATITAKTGITLNAASTTAATVATVDVLTVTGAGANISFTGNDTAAGANLGIDVGNVNLANGSSLSLISNNKITQTGTIASAVNTNGSASSILFDATNGSNASAVTIGTLTVAAATSTSDINLLVKSKGSSITASGPLATAAIPLPGTITFDNTNGGAITQATAVAGVGLTFNGGGVFGAKGISLTGVSNNNSAITSNQVLTSSTGPVILIGTTLTVGNIWGITASGTITGKSITVTATNNTTGTLATGGAVNLGGLTILAGGTDLLVTGNNSNQTAQGVVAGAVTDNAVGGNITFRSDNNVTSGAISLVANTGATTAAVTYDVTTGNKTSAISAGALTVGTGTNAAGIDYKLLTSGAPIVVGAVTVPGQIVLDNTYGAVSGPAASGFITLANAATYANTTTHGINISGALSGAKGITLKGATAGSNQHGVYTTGSLLAATGNIEGVGITIAGTAGSGFYISGTSALVTATTGNITFTGYELAGNAAVYLNSGAISAPLGSFTANGSASSTGTYGFYSATSATISAKNNVMLTGTTSGAYGMALNAAVTSTAGDIIISAQSGTNNAYADASALNASAGAITLSAASTTGAGLSQTGLVTAKSVIITGTINGAGIAVNLGAVTLVAGGGSLVVTGNNANQSGTGISQTGNITDNVVGGNITFRSNNNINQAGAITMVSNPGTAAAVLTYDVTTGNNTSSIIAGSLTITGTNTGPINYNLYAAGAQLNPGAITVSGAITLDNTYGGTAGAGGTPTSGFINAANLSLATTSYGIIVDSALSGAKGVTVRGASYSGSNVMGVRIWSNVTSSQGDIELVGYTLNGYGLTNVNPGVTWLTTTISAPLGRITVTGTAAGTSGYGVDFYTANTLSAKNISVTGTANGTGLAARVSNVVVLAGGGDLLMVGNNSNQSGTGLQMDTGTITSNAVGGSITFKSNNNINQTTAIGMVGNTSGHAAALTYDVTTGTNASSVVGGNLTITGSSTSPINYNLLASGAHLDGGALNIPGTITLDNTYGGTAGVGGTPTSGYITTANIAAAVSAEGISINNAMTGANGIVIKGVSGTSNAVNTTATLTATSGDILITGASGSGIGYAGSGALVATAGNVVLSGQSNTGSAINFSGAVTANAGNVVITGNAASSGNTWGTLASGLISARNITVTGTNNTTGTLTAGGAVYLGALTIVASGGNLLVTGNNSNQLSGGVYQAGAITDNANGGSILFKSNNNINQTGTLALAKNTSGTDSSVTYDLSTGNKTSSLVAGNLTVTAASTSGINYNVYTSGANLNPGTVSVPGVITLDNTWGGTAGVGGAPTSGYITSANRATLATASDGITLNNALVGGKGVVLRGVTTGNYGINANSAVTATTGGITLLGLGNAAAGFYGNGNAVLTANAGTIDITATTNAGNGLYNAGALSARTITILGEANSTSSGVVLYGTVTLVAGGTGLTVTGNNPNQAGQGVSANGSVVVNAIGGNVLFKSNNNINHTGNISMVANTSGQGSAVTYDVSTGGKSSTIVSGNLTITAGSTSNIDFNQYTAGATINPGVITVPGVITLDNTYGAATAGATPASGYLNASTLTTALVTSSDGITVNNTVSGAAGVVLRGVSFGGSAVSGSSAVSSSLGAIDVLGVSTTGNAVNLTGLLTAKGITLTGTRTLSSGNNSVRQGAMTILALTPTEAAAGVLGNVVITGNSFDQVGNGVYAYGNITSNANGGSVTFRSNNNINQTGTISLVANTSGHGSAITYDVSTGNKTSSIVTTNSVIAAGSTSGIDYNMFASGAALNPGLIRVPGVITLDNTYGAATAGATPVSGFITAANLASLATTSNPVVIDQGNALSGDRGVTIRSVVNSGIYGVAIMLLDNVTSSQGNISLTGTAANGYGIGNLRPNVQWYASALSAPSGQVSVTGTIGGSGNGIAVAVGLDGVGSITAKTIDVVGNATGLTGNAVRLGRLNLLAGGGDLTVTGNTVTQSGYGITQEGVVTIAGNGSSATFRSNNNITQNGLISVVANTSGHASAVTYDVSRGDKSSTVVINTPLTIAAGSTSRIDYNMFASGAVLNAGSLPTIPGVITIDNTYGAATAGATPVSGFLTTGNIALATTSNAIVINAGQPLVGQYGVTLRGATNGNTASKAILINDNITSASGAVVLDGVAGSGYGVFYPNTTYGLSGQSVTVIGNNLGTTTIAPVSIGKLNVLAGGGNLSVTGNKTTAGGAAGIIQNGNVTSLSSGGSLFFSSNNVITQNGAISVTANTSGHAAEVTYDTTAGNKLSVINPGVIAFTAGSTSDIHYKNLASGAEIIVNSALNVPGSIFLDNTWLNGASGGITAANASTYGTSVNGLLVSTSLTATGGITLKGVTGSASTTYKGVSVTAGTFTATGTFAVGQDAINITGVSAGVTANQSAISLTGTVAIINNSINGNTSLIALGGRYYDPVTITNAATAGAIAISAIGDSAAVVTTTATTVTQNSNAGVFVFSSNNGNVTPPRIVNNGTGPVAIAAGAYLPVGVATGGQIVGLSGNSITSPIGNVYLYSGMPTVASNSTTATSQNTLAYLDPVLGALDFGNTLFGKAYAAGNVAAGSPITTAAGLNTSEIFNALGSNNTATGSAVGPAIQFRFVAQANLLLSDNFTKVYGTNDPSAAYDSVAIAGSLENLLNARLIRNSVKNPGFTVVGGIEYFNVVANGVQFRLPMADFMNSVTGTRAQYGTLAGEQVTPGSTPYAYALTSRHGVLMAAGVDVTLVGNSAKAPYLGLEISAAPLSLTQSAQTKTYGQTLAPVGTGAQASGVINGVTVDGVTINDVLDSFAMTSAGFAPTANIGTYAITPGSLSFSTGSASNYAVSANSASVTVNRASLVVTAKNAVKFEGMPDTAGFLGVNYVGFANGESSSVLLSGGTTGITVARNNSSVNAIGAYPGVLIAAGPATRGNYAITYAPGDFEVKVLPPNTLAVIADTYATYGTTGGVSALSSVVYKDSGSVLHTLTYASGSGTATSGSYVYADGANGNVTFTLVPTGTALSSAGKPLVGAYALVGSGTLTTTIPSLTNTLLVAGNLNVTPANASITATATSLVYNSTVRTQSVATTSGFLSGDVLTIAGTQATGTHAGTYASAITVASGNANADLQNYNVTLTNANLTVTPAPLTLTGAGTVTKVYDATTNATLAFNSATLSGVFAGDTVGFDSTALTAVYPSKNVGTRALVISGGAAALTGASSSDYILTGLNAFTGTITPAPLALIGVGNTTKVYDRTTAASLNASGSAVSGLISGDVVVFDPAALTAVFADKNVGTGKALTVTAGAAALTGADAGNYAFANLASFTGSITPASLTLTGVGSATKVYDGSVDAPLGLGSSSVTGVLTGDTVSFSSTGLTAAYADKNVGTGKAITLTAGATALTGLDAGNYVIANLGAFTGTITRAAATLTATGSVTKVYDRTTAATLGVGAYTFTGVVSGDDVTLDSTQVSATFPNKNVGAGKALVVAAGNSALSGADAGNYSLTVGSGFVGEITPAPLTLTGFGSVTKVYDATVAAPLSTGSLALSGVISGDAVTANTSAVTASFDDKNVGAGKALVVSSAAVVLSGAGASNYSLQAVTGLTGTITPAQLLIGGLSVPASKVYDGTTAASVTGSPTFVGLLGTDSVSLVGSAMGSYNTKNVATANTVSFTGLTVSGADAGNYVISSSYTLPATITPAALTMSGLTVAASKVYDGNTSAVVGGAGVLAGIFGSDTVALSGTAVGTYNSKNVVTASQVALSGLTLGGADASNYTFTIQTPVAAIITPKTLTMSGLTTPGTKTYDGTTAATVSGTGMLSGVIGADAVSLGGTVVGAFDSPDVASASQVSFAGAILSGTASSNYVLTQQAPAVATITPATLTVTANADARFVGQSDAAGFNGVSYVGFVAGQDASTAGLTGSLAITRSNASTGSAGSYAGVLVPSGLSAGNYAINNVAANYEIIPAGQVLVKVANTTNVYGATSNYAVSSVQYMTVGGNVLSSLTLGTVSGSTYTFVDGINGSLTFTLGANGTLTPAGFLPVGNYVIAGSGIGQTGTNFTGTPTIIGVQTITPKALTTTASKVYDGTTVYTSAQVGLNGVLAGDTVSATGSTELATAGVASGKSYDLTGLSLAGTQAGNYFVDTSANATNGVVATKALTVTLLSDRKTYDGLAYVGGKGAIFAGFVNGEDASALGGSLVFGGSSQNAVNAGSYALSGSGFTSTNYAISYAPATLTVNKAALTVVAADAIRTYGAANPTFTTPLTGFVNGETLATSGVTGAGSATSVATATSNVGNYAIVPSASGYASNNYDFTGSVNGRLTVTPATLTVTANAATRQYGLVNPAFAGTVTGFVNGQSLAAATTGTLAFSTPATAASNVGSYDVTGYGLVANNGNYVFAQAAGNATALAVTPAPLTVTAAAATKTYDGLAFAGGNGVSYAGFRNADSVANLAGTLAFTGTSQGATNAGTYVLTPGGLSSGNYTLSFVNGALTIGKASLTLQAADANRVYGSANPSFVVNLLGFVNGETATSAGVTGSAGVTTAATASSNVGNYALTPTAGSLTAANYVFPNAIDGVLTVTPATLTIAANAANRQYGLVNPAFTGTVTGFVNGDTLGNATTGSLAFTTTATQASNVASYALSASGLTASHGNYLFVEAPANGTAFTVTPAPLTVTAVAATKTYDGLAYAGGNGVTYAGFRNGDLASGLTGTLAFTGTSQGAINAGTYAITPTGLSSANYTVSFVDGALTVAKASLTVTGGNSTRVYGAVNPGLTSTISGFVNGETFSNTGISGAASVTTAATATSNVGNYAIVPAAGTLAAANYSFGSFVNGTLAVTPATLTITANASTRLYGAADPAFSGTVSGFVNGETLASATTGTLLFTSTATVTSNVGSYALTGVDLLARHGNYVFVQDAANATALTVTPAPLTATAVSAAKSYDGVAYAGGAGLTFSGFRNADSAASLSGTATYAGTSQGATNVGSYVLTPGGLSSANYTISYAPGALTVNPAVLTASLASSDKVYDGNTSATGSLTLSGLVGSETLGVSATYAFNNKNVNLANTVTASSVTLADGTGLASNYVLASGQTATAHITPLAVAVTGVSAVNKVYDATDVATLAGTAIVTPLSGAGDSPVIIGTANATFADKNVGNTKAVTVGGYSLSGVGASNYSLLPAAGLTADITPATLRVAVNSDAKFVTTLDPATFNGVSLSGFLGADSLADVSGSATITRTNAAVNGAGTYAGVLTATGLSAQNYVMNYTPGDFTVVPADRILVRVANETVTYGTAANPSVQSVQYFNGSTGLVSLTRVGATNTFDDGVVGGNGTVTFSVVAANPLLSAGGNLRVGTYGLGVETASLVITGTNFTGTPVVAGTLNVTPLSVQVTGITAANKAYDRNNAATVSGGVIASLTGDAVSVSAAGVVASFADKMAANGKSVTATGYALTGADASNYQLVQPAVVTANITPISLTVTGATALNKAYDGTSVATISGGAITLAAGEAVSLVTSGVVGAFADSAVANGKSVTALGFALSGADATNYVLAQPSGFTANITRRLLTFSNAAASSKVYDRTKATTGSLSLVGVVGSESVLASVGAAAFLDKNVGTAKTVNLTGITLSGTDAGNYVIVSTATATADITALALTLISQAAASKVYDAGTLTTGSVALSGVITGDAVGVSTPSARFVDKNVGTGKTVNLTGIALTGADAGNYSVASSTTALANISTLALNVTGVTAANKAYDRLTAATVSGGVISVLGADVVNLNASGATGVFADKNAAVGKTVNARGYVISGADAANYSLVQPAGVTADITPLYLSLAGLSASDKTYDGSTAAKATGTLVGVLAGDTALVSSLAGTFADAEIGTGKTVTITTGVLTGADAINYRITPGQATTASITRKDDGTNNFLLGASKIAGIGGFKSFDSSDFKYPLPKTFLLGSADAVKQGEPATLTTGEIGARPVTGYYTSEEQPTGTTSFRYVYPKVNLGQAYYVGALGGDDAKAAGGETTETVEAK